jgi:GNAT superfamily N-acetyltransferase
MKFHYSKLLSPLADHFVYKAQVELGDSILWASINGKIVGYVDYVQSGIDLNILYIETVKDHQRRGIAKKLMTRIIKDLCVPQSIIHVVPGSFEGVEFFKKMSSIDKHEYKVGD